VRVFLIHGMGRGPVAMAWLAQRLARGGHTVSNFGYRVRREDMPQIAARFTAHVHDTVGRDGGSPYAVVSHSLGGIITRHVSPQLPAGFARFAMLAPPNNPPALARAFARSPVFRMMTRDAGRRLRDRQFYESLPVPEVETLVVAGDRNPLWLPYRGSRPADGIVSVEETRLPGARHEVIRVTHSFIMNHPDVVARVLSFLDEEDAARDSAY
jgi:alpha-beta hydrolase superfamily lysophospholipase